MLASAALWAGCRAGFAMTHTLTAALALLAVAGAADTVISRSSIVQHATLTRCAAG